MVTSLLWLLIQSFLIPADALEAMNCSCWQWHCQHQFKLAVLCIRLCTTLSPPLWPCRFKQIALWLHENACIRWRTGQKEKLSVFFWLLTPHGELLEAACANCRCSNLSNLCQWTQAQKQSVLETVHTQPCLPNPTVWPLQCARLEASLLACLRQQSFVEQH